MTAPVFVDTNVLVYRFDTTEVDKQQRSRLWLDRLWSDRLGRVSRQVQHELYVTLTRKLSMPRGDARRIVRALEAWQPHTLDASDIDAAWQIEDRWSLTWWDALIVAAARRCGARTILTEDLQHGLELDDLVVVNPFREGPPSGPAVHEPESAWG
jgi:predicted nucleic acid-binding protein